MGESPHTIILIRSLQLGYLLLKVRGWLVLYWWRDATSVQLHCFTESDGE